MHLEKLKEAEEKAKPIIQAIQQKIDESAKGMATRNAKYQKEIAGLEVCFMRGKSIMSIFCC
jgi:hypothetical protein